jgi:endonuclease I
MKRIFVFVFLFPLYFFSQSNFGPPSNPTYAVVQTNIPQGYYDQANNLSSDELKEALHQIISNHVIFPYTSNSTDTWDILQQSDQDPNENNNMILVYTGRSQEKGYRDGSGNYSQYENGNGTQSNSWNREHIWPKSHGFPDEDDNAYTDVHNLKPCDRSVNSSRGTKDFDFGGNQHSEASDCLTDSDSWEPPDYVKGDIARILFYMVVRYDPGVDHENNTFDLELVDYTTPNNTEPILGKLSSLLDWHLSDPVDDFEINRNEIIFGFQQNRNPFIDHPNLVNYLWGDNVGLVWNENLTVPENEIVKTIIYPNPSSGIINFSSDMEDEIIEIFNLNGQNILNKIIDSSNSVELDLPSGIYFLRSNTKSGIYNSKLIIN